MVEIAVQAEEAADDDDAHQHVRQRVHVPAELHAAVQRRDDEQRGAEIDVCRRPALHGAEASSGSCACGCRAASATRSAARRPCRARSLARCRRSAAARSPWVMYRHRRQHDQHRATTTDSARPRSAAGCDESPLALLDQVDELLRPDAHGRAGRTGAHARRAAVTSTQASHFTAFLPFSLRLVRRLVLGLFARTAARREQQPRPAGPVSSALRTPCGSRRTDSSPGSCRSRCRCR